MKGISDALLGMVYIAFLTLKQIVLRTIDAIDDIIISQVCIIYLNL